MAQPPHNYLYFMAREWLQQLRQNRKMSQLELGKAAGIRPPERYGRMEKGYADIDPASATGLAGFLGVSSSFVATGSDSLPLQSAAVKKGVSVEPARDLSPIAQPAPKDAALPPPRGLAARRQAEAGKLQIVSTTCLIYDGGDILEPTNFQALPPIADLESQGRDILRYRADLKVLINRANKVLHTSKIPAKIWLAWREFEKRAQSMLAGGDQPLSTPIYREVQAVPSQNSPEAALSAEPSAEGRRSHKNFAGRFFDLAREALPPESFSDLEKKAIDAKKVDPSAGFMKHFHRLSQQQLTPAQYASLEEKARNAILPRAHSAPTRTSVDIASAS